MKCPNSLRSPIWVDFGKLSVDEFSDFEEERIFMSLKVETINLMRKFLYREKENQKTDSVIKGLVFLL